jgi:hypothetical protein
MKDTNYNSAKTLEDVLTINSQEWSEHCKPRNEMLMQLASEVESVGELGVNQGTSFCFLMLQKPKKIVGVDISLKKWRLGSMTSMALEPLALEFMKENPMEYKMYECSSTNTKCVNDLDMLHIDSLHHPNHLQQELDIHASRVNRYIAFHDTKLKNRETTGEYALWKVVDRFLNDHPEWELKEHYTEGRVGHAAIQRT